MQSAKAANRPSAKGDSSKGKAGSKAKANGGKGKAPSSKAPSAEDPAAVDVPRPKRPLTSFNLFFRFKRKKVLDLLAFAKAVGKEASKSDIEAVVSAPPGLERALPSDLVDMPPASLLDLQRANVRRDLAGNLEPKAAAKRSHRTDAKAMNGNVSFVELGRLMNASWGRCDDGAKAVFRELAEEGRDLYRTRVGEYDAAAAKARKRAAEEKAARIKRKKEKAAKREKRASKADGKPGKKRVAKEASKSKKREAPAAPAAAAAAAVPDGPLKKRFRATPAPHPSLQLDPKRPPLRRQGSHVSDCELSDESAHGRVPGSEEEKTAKLDIHRYLGRLNDQRAVVAPSPTEQQAKPPVRFHQRHPPPARASSAPVVPRAVPRISPHGQSPQVRMSSSGAVPPPLPAAATAAETALRARVKELEDRLTEERLRARVRELEIDLAKKTAVERRLRAQNEMTLLRETQLRAQNEMHALKVRESQLRAQLLSPTLHPLLGTTLVQESNLLRPSSAPAPPPPAAASSPEPKPAGSSDGIMALVNASMIHPLLHAHDGA